MVMRMMSSCMRWRYIFGLILASALIAPVHATVVIPAGVAELALEARAIVHGRVVRIDTRQGEGLRVERIVTVQVADYLKGGLGNVVQLQLPGGSFGRYRTIQIGAPEIEEGDEVVLFLGQGETDPLPHLLGFHQGLYRLVTDPDTGARFVMPPMVQGDATSAQATPVTRGDATRRPQTLDEFRAAIANVLKSPPTRGADAVRRVR
jgi:hypothetical protein